MVSRIIDSYTFASSLAELSIDDDETIVSFDIISLYTSIPIKQCLSSVHSILLEDTDLQSRTNLSPPDLIRGLEICLRSTYFTFKGALYHQTEGVAMGSPVSPIVATLFMHHLEVNAFEQLLSPP